ncbi:hypothetical protein GUITHDRAFT_48118, partial [Guillardia theta CCMP2712]
VAGVDEAGRGPLAGPVVAAAVILPAEEEEMLRGIKDSKKMTEEEREACYETLTQSKKVTIGVSVIEHEVIDEINILQATMLGMSSAVKQLEEPPDFVLVDGNRCPSDLSAPSQAIVKGDSKCMAIAAASIIAKVTRDRIMKEHHERWPVYDFAQHKGYGTSRHVAAISKHGPCPIHRKTFEPIKSLLAA